MGCINLNEFFNHLLLLVVTEYRGTILIEGTQAVLFYTLKVALKPILTLKVINPKTTPNCN